MKRILHEHPAWLVMLAVFAALAPMAFMRDFSAANELRYLSIADEAIASGHFFVMSDQGVPYADKPPLYLWLVMLCRLIAGKHSMPLLCMLAFLPACVIVDTMDRWLCKALPGRFSLRERLGAATMLATSGLFLELCFFIRMDTLMAMFIVLALYAFREEKPWAFAIFTFLAVFTKGLAGLIPVFTVLVLCLVQRQGRRLRHFIGWRFLVVALAGCLFWFGGIWFEGGTPYLRNLLVHQTYGRVVQAFDHQQPWWFFLPVIWEVISPYSLLAIPAVVASFLRPDKRTEDERILAIAMVAGFMLMSLSKSKLPIYLVPLIPFAVYTVPLVLKRSSWRPWWQWGLIIPAFLGILLGLGTVAIALRLVRIPAFDAYGFIYHPAVVAGGLLLAGGSLAALLLARREWPRSVFCLAGGMLALQFTICLFLMRDLNPYVGYRDFCSKIPEDAKIYTARVYRPSSIDVYLGRDVTRDYGRDYDELAAEIPDDGILVIRDKALQESPSLAEALAPYTPYAQSGVFLLYDLRR